MLRSLLTFYVWLLLYFLFYKNILRPQNYSDQSHRMEIVVVKNIIISLTIIQL